jgi:crossover junction endodeoxyribonuclease RuvC
VYIGIDPSLTGTSIIKIDDNKNIVSKKYLSTKSEDKIEKRLNYIFDEVVSMIDKDDIVYIEGLSFASRGQATLDLAGLHYLITTFLDRNNIKFKDVSPGSWKKWLTGKGNCKNDKVMLYVFKKFNMEFDTTDDCVAYTLARMTYEENKRA